MKDLFVKFVVRDAKCNAVAQFNKGHDAVRCLPAMARTLRVSLFLNAVAAEGLPEPLPPGCFVDRLFGEWDGETMIIARP
jgi:hypothetical protein